jgi:hypothetical protein
VDNLTDSHTILNYNHQTPAYDSTGVHALADLLASPAFRYYTYRPRTFGIDFYFKH